MNPDTLKISRSIPISILVLILASLVSICVGDDIDTDEAGVSLRRRILLRKISSASDVDEETRNDRSAAFKPGNISPYVPQHRQAQPSPPSTITCKYCPTVSCEKRQVFPPERRKARILYGVEADYGSHPWQVSIEKRGESTGEKWKHICGGALISKFHVLTAAVS